MQMSRERLQEIHKLIWNTVIEWSKEITGEYATVNYVKGVGLRKAFREGLLDADEFKIIKQRNYCLLCASFLDCRDCVLQGCNSVNSLYQRARRGDTGAMIEIRDIVDKKPFTELSIVTIYG